MTSDKQNPLCHHKIHILNSETMSLSGSLMQWFNFIAFLLERVTRLKSPIILNDVHLEIINSDQEPLVFNAT